MTYSEAANIGKQKKHMVVSEWSHDMYLSSHLCSLSECVPRVSGVWSGALVEHGNILTASYYSGCVTHEFRGGT